MKEFGVKYTNTESGEQIGVLLVQVPEGLTPGGLYTLLNKMQTDLIGGMLDQADETGYFANTTEEN